MGDVIATVLITIFVTVLSSSKNSNKYGNNYRVAKTSMRQSTATGIVDGV